MNSFLPSLPLTMFLVLAAALLIQFRRIARSRLGLHNSMRAYRHKAVTEGFADLFEQIVRGTSNTAPAPFWKAVDPTVPGKAYREALRVAISRRGIGFHRQAWTARLRSRLRENRLTQ